MLKIRLATALIFLVQAALSQNVGKLSGSVRSKKSEAIVGATVTVTKARNGALIKAALTDEEGKFEFESIGYDSCKVSVSFVGMAPYTSDVFVLNAQNAVIALQPITLAEAANTLAEVNVTAQKPFVQQKIDRVTINPDALIGNAGTTSLEVLEKAPGVMVDANGVISLKGKPGVAVFIDDKPTYLSAADLANYLRSLPSGAIESIDIMTNPPAKYDAAGNAGVINIRLKKSIAKGFNGGLSLSYGQGRYLRTNNSFNFNYRINRFNFFSSASVNQNNSYQDLTIERRYFTPAGQLSSTFVQNSLIRPEARAHNLKIGVDFYATEQTTLGLVLSGFRNPSVRNVDNTARLTEGTNQVSGLVEATNPMDILFRNGSINLNFTHKIGKAGKELTGNFDYIAYQSAINQTLTNRILAPDRTFVGQSVLVSSLPSDLRIRAAKVDYRHPLPEGGAVDAGLKTSFVQTSNIADFFDVNGSARVPNYDFSNNFQYDENINAAYLNYSRDFTKISVQAGLRLENTNISGNQLGNPVVKDSSFVRNYTNVFPTFYFQYRIDTLQTHQLGLSLGRRIDRPDYKDLNPFTYPLDRFTYYGGNPFLQPTFAYTIEVSHTYKNTLTTTLEYSQANNVISETNEQRGTIYYSRPGNFAKQVAYGLSVNGSFKPFKWWTVQLYTGVFNNVFRSPIYTETLNASQLYWVFMPTNQFQISRLWTAELAGSYQTRVLSGQFLVIPIGSVRAGIATKLWKEKATLKLNVSDVFYTNQVGGDIRNIANSAANWYSFLDSRVATLSFSYRFSKGQNLKVRQSGGSESEQKRVKT
ncbi:MAG: TonB-dependent receptor family protein [Cytophagales bacterium]|jgi:hypothetical protein|nr:TonB-dependent receptor family protein [Cytophagales bacterium]